MAKFHLYVLSQQLEEPITESQKSDKEDTQDIYILWHVDPLLSNDGEISKYTAAITK
jgi:hypothetical protein